MSEVEQKLPENWRSIWSAAADVVAELERKRKSAEGAMQEMIEVADQQDATRCPYVTSVARQP